jgi:GT2 family glycosyltransferase
MKSMAQVTLIVTQRERFSYTQASLESIYQNTHVLFDLFYVDGNSPSHIQQYVEAQAKEKGFTLVRKETYLAPNQARNLVLNQVKTPYVVFIDNDVLVTSGWLERLIECAQETGALLVSPLYLEGKPEDQVIHMAGGFAHFREKQGKKTFFEKHRWCKRKVGQVQEQLKREPTELVEFHCTLIKMSVFEQLGILDEQFMSTAEHIDLCLQIRDLAGKEAIYFEPNSVISYVAPPPFEATDLPYFRLRWSEEWNRISLEHFRQKWQLTKDDPFIRGHYKWLAYHRQLAAEKSLHKTLSIRYDSWLNRTVLSQVEDKLPFF